MAGQIRSTRISLHQSPGASACASIPYTFLQPSHSPPTMSAFTTRSPSSCTFITQSRVLIEAASIMPHRLLVLLRPLRLIIMMPRCQQGCHVVHHPTGGRCHQPLSLASPSVGRRLSGPCWLLLRTLPWLCCRRSSGLGPAWCVLHRCVRGGSTARTQKKWSRHTTTACEHLQPHTLRSSYFVIL